MFINNYICYLLWMNTLHCKRLEYTINKCFYLQSCNVLRGFSITLENICKLQMRKNCGYKQKKMLLDFYCIRFSCDLDYWTTFSARYCSVMFDWYNLLNTKRLHCSFLSSWDNWWSVFRYWMFWVSMLMICWFEYRQGFVYKCKWF